jgi:hypothetical protein
MLRLPDHRFMVFLPDLVDQIRQALCNILGRLAIGASIPPNVPTWQALLGPLLLNLRACDSLVISIVPLPDVFCNGNLGFGADRLGLVLLLLPGELVPAADVQELESLLSS